MPRTPLPILMFACSLWLGCGAPAMADSGDKPIEFNRDVRPILTENCFACHGPDKNKRKAKLRLDVHEVALERGAVVPGKPDESKLVEHIFSEDPDAQMPPPQSGKSLANGQKELLKRWIASGAEYQPHWSYMKLQRPPVPQTRNPYWVRNPVDAFILRALEEKSIQPSPEAAKATLLRRISLDLIGLPPSPEEVRAFLADRSPNAYERVVDRMLNSPHFGERMAVPWLDVVRYADTVGYHGDQNQNVFPYRDYVIDAFNRNKPFDQFTLEQLAGDLLPDRSIEAYVASGFNRLNMMTREGGAQPKEYLAKYAADRVRTVSMTWLGSTMGCAECHDHKYDPFTSKDFYQMEAFFADIQQWGVYTDYEYTPNPDLKGFDNDHPFPPEIELDSPYLQRRLARLRQKASVLESNAVAQVNSDAKRREAYETWRQTSLKFLRQWPTGWATPAPAVDLKLKDKNAVVATNYTVQTDAQISFGDLPAERLQVTLPLSNMWVAAIRLEIVPKEEPAETAAKGEKSKKRKGVSVALSAKLGRASGGAAVPIPFYHAEADHLIELYSNGASIIGVTDLWKISTEHEKQTAVWLLEAPIDAKAGDTLVVDLGGVSVSSARLSVSPFAAADPLAAGIGEPLRKALSKKVFPRHADLEFAEATYLISTSTPQDLAQWRKTQDEIRECRKGRAFSLVTTAREPAVTRVLPRGNWQNESGEIVQPLVPHFLPQISNPENRRLNRLDLARWLISPENPLTSRAVMNRLWKQFFGTGISAIVDDLGAQGEWPVHPELLDWLACEFMQPQVGEASNGNEAQRPQGWDFKHMVKLIVMSSTYRQNSNQRPELKEIDPNNRLLACQSPRRLEAEFVRDNALSIAGLLNLEMGGPSVRPYQPAGYYAYLQFPDRDYVASPDERQYRRGLYMHWQRAFLHPMLANFDAPSREECTANRVVSDTPQQALTLLNDPTFLEASHAFADRLLTDQGRTDAQRLDRAFEKALARTPRENEKKSLLEFLAVQRKQYEEQPKEAEKLLKVGNSPARNDQPAEEAAWTQVCRVILNLHETITRY
jgi:hypothetical protein